MVKRFKTKLGSTGPRSLFIEVPFDVKAAFGKARPPVVVVINKHSYRSTIAVYAGRSYVPVRKSMRATNDETCSRNAQTNASAASSTSWFIVSEREPSIVPFVSRRQLAHRTGRVARVRDTDVARHGAGLTEHVQFAAGILADAEDAGTEL